MFTKAWSWVKALPWGNWTKPLWKSGAKFALRELAKRTKAKLAGLVDEDTDASIKAINGAFDGLQAKALQALNFVKFMPAEMRDKIAAHVKEDGDRIQAEAVDAIKKGGPAALAAILDKLESRLEAVVDKA